MRTVYRAENVFDASLVKGLLESAGILAFVNGSYLQGGVGELPVSGFVTVSVVEDDYPEARSIVEAFERDRREPGVEEQEGWDPADPLPEST